MAFSFFIKGCSLGHLALLLSRGFDSACRLVIDVFYESIYNYREETRVREKTYIPLLYRVEPHKWRCTSPNFFPGQLWVRHSAPTIIPFQ